MKRRLQTSAAFLTALALFNLSGTIQSATAADEAKGFRGYVCDDLGKPVPNAKVAVNYHPVKTDSQGRFFVPHEKLKHDGGRSAFVTVEATLENKERPRLRPWEANYAGCFHYVTGEENVTIQPHGPVVLGGRVLSVDGKAIPGATVSANISNGGLTQFGLGRVREPVKTDQEGHFRIPKLYDNNDYWVRIEVAGYERKWMDPIRIGCRDAEPVDIHLREAPASVAGRVVDAQGSPVAKARVQLRYPNSKDPDATAETDAEGNFRIDSLFTDQEVELWANGTTVKTKAGTSNLRIVARPKL
jgi:uncharacterized GH25 family protein